MCSSQLRPLPLILLALAVSHHFILLTNQRSIPTASPPAAEPPPSSRTLLADEPEDDELPDDEPPQPPPPPPQPEVGPPSSPPMGVIVGAVIIGLVVVILIVGLCTFFMWRKKRRGRQSTQPQPPESRELSSQMAHSSGSPLLLRDSLSQSGAQQHSSAPTFPSHQVQRAERTDQPLDITVGLSQSWFTYEELVSATNGFSYSNFLGQGGFGYVHKGVLPNGKTVAIKQLKSESRQGEREFQAEVEVISRVHHRHLVSLVGYCIGEGQRMLVYEFVPNNTLEFHLHGIDGTTMEWAARIKIAIGSAKGLAYLHEDCYPKIIHRDIKASNILLDDNFEPKVADFGLAKFSLDVDTHVSTRVMGTFGYLAPEYAASGKLTEKSDVFSYGVVLLELITGRKPVDKTESFTYDSMVELARPLLSQAMGDGNFDALADPRLQNSYDSAEMLRMITCAANCVRHSARQRPRMSQVVRALEGNISLDDLNEGGSTPGRSRAFSSFESTGYDTGQYNEDLKKLRNLALEQETSEYSGPSSEYGQHQSTSSSSGLQNAQEK